MTLFSSIFTCNSSKDNDDLDDLKDRVSKLEIKYDNLYEILRDIKMNIEMIKMRMDLLLTPQQM